MDPGTELDIIVAKFLGYEVKPLKDWLSSEKGGPWWPAHDRNEVVMTVWLVEDPEDRVASIEAKYPEGENGEWTPYLIPKYSTQIHKAWPVFLEIRKKYLWATVGEKEVALKIEDWSYPERAKNLIIGKDAPHAIALAAKKIWEEKNP